MHQTAWADPVKPRQSDQGPPLAVKPSVRANEKHEGEEHVPRPRSPRALVIAALDAFFSEVRADLPLEVCVYRLLGPVRSTSG